ncbi:MAG: hypothetical protein ACRBDL_08335 [Alphaproteobacteria bacterium]
MMQLEQRDEIINSIPDEGALSYTSSLSKRAFDFSEEDAQRIVEGFFQGKIHPDEGDQKTARILLGAPGSGKSYNARKDYNALGEEERNKTIFVSYDELGAIFAIDDYVQGLKDHVPDYTDEHAPVDDTTLGIRTELWDDYRLFSQRARNMILKRALSDGYNVMIDTTSSSMGSVKLIENVLKPLGYRIHTKGTFAPFHVGVDRLHTRVRPASNEEAVTKRVGDPDKNSGALNMILPMIKASDDFEYDYNPSNEEAPRLAFAYQDGMLDYCDEAVIDQMIDDLDHEVDQVIAFINQNNIDPAYKQYVSDTNDEFARFLDINSSALQLNYNPDGPDVV